MGVTGAILSGGKSRRMGVPKAEILLPDGRTMIETVRDTLAEICDEVVLVGASFGLLGHRIIKDAREDAGPLAGIEALLASGISEQYLVVPCDMPLFDTSTASPLLQPSDSPMAHFRHHPIPCRVDACLLETAGALLDRDENAVHALAREAHALVVTPPTDASLSDVDTPEALETFFTRSRPGSP